MSFEPTGGAFQVVKSFLLALYEFIITLFLRVVLHHSDKRDAPHDFHINIFFQFFLELDIAIQRGTNRDLQTAPFSPLFRFSMSAKNLSTETARHI